MAHRLKPDHATMQLGDPWHGIARLANGTGELLAEIIGSKAMVLTPPVIQRRIQGQLSLLSYAINRVQEWRGVSTREVRKFETMRDKAIARIYELRVTLAKVRAMENCDLLPLTAATVCSNTVSEDLRQQGR